MKSLFEPSFGSYQNNLKDKKEQQSIVYFIRQGIFGPVKIGITVDLQHRLKSLQTGSPTPLFVLGTIPGGLNEEKILHSRFKAYRVSGEWFVPDDAMLLALETIISNQHI